MYSCWQVVANIEKKEKDPDHSSSSKRKPGSPGPLLPSFASLYLLSFDLLLRLGSNNRHSFLHSNTLQPVISSRDCRHVNHLFGSDPRRRKVAPGRLALLPRKCIYLAFSAHANRKHRMTRPFHLSAALPLACSSEIFQWTTRIPTTTTATTRPRTMQFMWGACYFITKAVTTPSLPLPKSKASRPLIQNTP